MRILAVAIAVTFLIAGCSDDPAQMREDAENAYFIGDYPTAVALFTSLAEQGDPIAQVSLGYMFTDGLGVTQDFSQGLIWFELAAEQGDADARYNIGRAFGLGRGAPQDPAIAALWYQFAAEKGHALAQADLAEIHAAGRGIGQNFTLAYAWATVAAEQGVFSAGETRDAVAGELSPEALDAAFTLSQEYWQRYVVPFQN